MLRGCKVFVLRKVFIAKLSSRSERTKAGSMLYYL